MIDKEGREKKSQKGGKHFIACTGEGHWLLLPKVLGGGALECELLIRMAFFRLIPLWVAGLESARLGRLPTASGSGDAIQ